MSLETDFFDRIIELEESLVKLKRSIDAGTADYMTRARYEFNYGTYIANIKMLNQITEELYISKFKALS